MFDKRYLEQVKILLEVIPLVTRYDVFAIKGGTAINFFVLGLPRLSVDIDLCYLPIQPREETFNRMNQLMMSLMEDIKKRFPGYSVKTTKSMNANVYKLLVSSKRAILKIEPNEVLRGSVKTPLMMNVSTDLEGLFNLYPEGRVLDIPDLYGGKICAALDRQHPRDLFDIHMMFLNNLFSDEVRKVFLVYLIQSNRPIAEILDSKALDFSKTFESEFRGMVKEDVSLDNLLEAREVLLKWIWESMTKNEKEFLLSVKAGEPEWKKLGTGDFSHFPGVKWKIFNINKMKKARRLEAYKKLEKVLARN